MATGRRKEKQKQRFENRVFELFLKGVSEDLKLSYEQEYKWLEDSFKNGKLAIKLQNGEPELELASPGIKKHNLSFNKNEAASDDYAKAVLSKVGRVQKIQQCQQSIKDINGHQANYSKAMKFMNNMAVEVNRAVYSGKNCDKTSGIRHPVREEGCRTIVYGCG